MDLETMVAETLGLGTESTEKVASADDQKMASLAASMGLFGDDTTETTTEKVASEGAGITAGLFETYFGEDTLDPEKVASSQQAQYEEALGARTFDYFANRVDARVEKIAMEMTGSATISAPVDSIEGNSGNAHGDGRPRQQQQNTRPNDAGEKIDTTPDVTNILPPQKGDMVSGSETKKEAAVLRKHLLLSQLDD